MSASESSTCNSSESSPRAEQNDTVIHSDVISASTDPVALSPETHSSSENNECEMSESLCTSPSGETSSTKDCEVKSDEDAVPDDNLEKENKDGLCINIDSSKEDNSVSLSLQPEITTILSTEMNTTSASSEVSVQHIGEVFHCSPAPNGLSESILNHPAYKTVILDLTHFKEQVNQLQKEIYRLEGENQRLEADRSHEIYAVQLETLEKTIAQQQNELQKLSMESRQQAEVATKNYKQMKEELESKIQKLTKQCETANADRESMVMRYVNSEKEVIDLKKIQENLEKKLKESNKERELLFGKLKTMNSEKARICQILDNKIHDLTTVQKENERMKDDLNSREIKIKWLQNKLKTEMDTHKETQTKADKLVLKLQECREETEQVRRDCQETMRAFQESEDNKAHVLGQQLKEQQAKLIMERHEKEGHEQGYKQLQQEVDILKKKNQIIIEENNILSVKVQNLEKERLEYEQNLSKLKWSLDKQRHEIVDLQNQVAEMEALKMQMQHGQEKLTSCQGEVQRLQESNEELLQEMALCREREAELLEFTQKLTEKNVRLQSEFSATEAKAKQLELEVEPLQRHLQEVEGEVSDLQDQLKREKAQRLEESSLLARHLAERTKHAEDLSRQVDDLQGEIQVLKRKNQTAVKELTRELQHYRKKEAANESSSGSNSLGQASRTSSCSSLNTVSEGSQVNGGRRSPESDPSSNQLSAVVEPDRQMLIERIVKLQRANARKQEKLEFLEEHAKQLVSELQKKTRIVQHYIMREQVGALSSDSMDQNKAEVVKYGGIMASLYGSKAVDNTMTLELSLEINKKLQAVLEDTLLKNITLKENIDTLGSEIARLTMQKKKLDVNR